MCCAFVGSPARSLDDCFVSMYVIVAKDIPYQDSTLINLRYPYAKYISAISTITSFVMA
jgi:hypothetical protein